MGGGRVPRLLFLFVKRRAVHQSRERRREEQKGRKRERTKDEQQARNRERTPWKRERGKRKGKEKERKPGALNAMPMRALRRGDGASS